MSTSEEKLAPQKQPKRKRLLLLLTAFFVIMVIAYLIYWFLVLRHHQETDNAVVAGNQVQIMAQVSGSVATVNFDNTDLVKEGDVLVILEPTDAEQAFERAKTALANTVRQTHQLLINSKQYQANIELNKVALSQAEKDYQRRVVLGASNVIGREELQHAKEAVDSARSALDVAVQQYNANQALILNTPLEQQPAVLQAAVQVRETWLALQRTRIVSPITGYVSHRNVQVGSQITPSTPLMAIVAADHLWVDANFKETQLANIRIGQPVTLTSDIYGDDIVFQGQVVGLDMSTGSASSILPAQNATGNWIKVVQRLPVRIELDAQQVTEHPLRIGFSMLAKVDTTATDGQVLSTTVRTTPAYHSQALSLDLSPVEQIIAEIIRSNAS